MLVLCSSSLHKNNFKILSCLSNFVKCKCRFNFSSWALYLNFRTYEVNTKQLYSSGIHKCNISVFSHLCDLVKGRSIINFESVVLSCKCNCVFLKKPFLIVLFTPHVPVFFWSSRHNFRDIELKFCILS